MEPTRMWLVDDSRTIIEYGTEGQPERVFTVDYPTPVQDIIEGVFTRFDEATCQSDRCDSAAFQALHAPAIISGIPMDTPIGWGLGENADGIPQGDFRTFYVVDDGTDLFVVCEDCGPPLRRRP